MELSYQLWKPGGIKAGSGSARRVVLLHGMGGTGQLWRPVAASLEEHYEILAPDQRGHGKSRVPAGAGKSSAASYRPLDYGQDLVDTVAALGFFPSWVVGHSMGVRTACAFAHLKPQWTSGLVLVDLGFSGVAGGGLGEGLASFIRKLPEGFASRREARTFMAANCPDPAIAQYLMAVAAPRTDGGVGFPFEHSALIRTIESARDTSVRQWVEELGRRKLPIAVFRGQDSLVWSHDEFETERSRFSGYASIRFEEIPGAGHGLPFEQRQVFVQRLIQLMEEAELRA